MSGSSLHIWLCLNWWHSEVLKLNLEVLLILNVVCLLYCLLNEGTQVRILKWKLRN